MEKFAIATQIFSNIATIIGIIIAIISYKNKQRKDELEKIRDREERIAEREEREYGTYNDLDDKYVEFMYECAKNTDLDLFSENIPDGICSDRDITRERALFSVLISIFERAHVMFNRRCENNSEIKQKQYNGWLKCMKMYSKRDSFIKEWRAIGDQFDSDFQSAVNELINSNNKNIDDY